MSLLLYLISFFCSLIGFFGVGHLFAGAPGRAVSYFIAGLIWMAVAGAIGLSTGVGVLCLLPMHLVFMHFCAADAVRIAKGQG